MADVICTQREAHQIHHREAAEDRCLHPDTIRLYQPCMGYKPCACTQTPSLHAGKGRFVSLHHPFLAPPPPPPPRAACVKKDTELEKLPYLSSRTSAGTRRGKATPRWFVRNGKGAGRGWGGCVCVRLSEW